MVKDISRSVPPKIRLMLAVFAGGRCEFCNEFVLEHHLTKHRGVFGEDAHIIGFEKNGPRGNDPTRPSDPHEITNLMLLCPQCHKLVDDREDSFPATDLRARKLEHEGRVRSLTEIAPDRRSHVLLYGANIGEQSATVSEARARLAMAPDWYPASSKSLDLTLKNSSWHDKEPSFWSTEEEHLRRHFERHVRPRIADGSAPHISVFAHAPQPLLILLGALLTDIVPAEVYQLHREPPGWQWQAKAPPGSELRVHAAPGAGRVALVLSLSATVSDDRIRRVLGEDVAIWKVTVERPHNDLLQSRAQLREFRQLAREVLDRIKAKHPAAEELHVFPVAPVAINVELGRVHMPKADLPLRLYDEQRSTGGFIEALCIGATAR